MLRLVHYPCQMARLLIAAIVLAAAVTLYGLFDCLLRDRGLVRVLPKPVWVLIILFIPVLGFVLWYIFGRGSDGTTTTPARRRGPSAPDDDDDYLRQVDRDVKLGKHAPENRSRGDEEPAPEDTTDDSEEADTSADTDDRGTKGDGRGHSS